MTAELSAPAARRWRVLSAGLGSAVVLGALGAPLWIALGAIPGAPFLARQLRLAQTRRTAARLAAQLPDALTGLAAGLRAGRALPQALAEVARTAPPPLGAALSGLVRESGFNVPIETSLDRLVRTWPGEDMRLVATALELGHRLGGDLADLADRLAETIRERQRLEDRLRVLTAQGRAQGVVLAALPVALALAVHSVDPDYLRPLLDTRAGRAAVGSTVVLELIGLAAIRRIVRPEP
jgi:tight adherence protein B